MTADRITSECPLRSQHLSLHLLLSGCYDTIKAKRMHAFAKSRASHAILAQSRRFMGRDKFVPVSLWPLCSLLATAKFDEVLLCRAASSMGQRANSLGAAGLTNRTFHTFGIKGTAEAYIAEFERHTHFGLLKCLGQAVACPPGVQHASVDWTELRQRSVL